MVEKQEYFKLLDNYQKIFVKNIEFLQNHSESLINFQHSIKYYLNPNNLYLKIVAEANKKSDWLIRTKKILQ
jgi:hypothetical protein